MARVPLGARGFRRSAISGWSLNFRAAVRVTRTMTQEEVYVLDQRAVARAKLGDEIVDLRPFDALRVGKDTPGSFEAGPEGRRS